MKQYPLAESTLTPEQFLFFIEGFARELTFQQVKGLTSDDIKQLSSVGAKPFLFDDGVHMMSDMESFNFDDPVIATCTCSFRCDDFDEFTLPLGAATH